MADDDRLEEIVEELSKVSPPLKDEPAAFKRACIRMGLERGVVEAAKVFAKRGRA